MLSSRERGGSSDIFPDPWPKKRHIKRRLINDDFVKLVKPLFKHGGQFRMATDWENYAEQMLDVMTRAEGFQTLLLMVLIFHDLTGVL